MEFEKIPEPIIRPEVPQVLEKYRHRSNAAFPESVTLGWVDLSDRR